MNIRNLLFISMIFCAAPVVSVASSFAKASADKPEVSLTKQEQEKVRQWAKIIKKETSEVGLKIIKLVLAAARECGLLELSKARLDKNKLEHREEMIGAEALVSSKINYELNQLIKKLGSDTELEKIEELTKNFTFDMLVNFEGLLDLDSEEIITERYIARVKKFVAIYSLTIKCL